MNRFVLALVFCGFAAAAVPAAAQDAQEQFTAPTPAPNQFSDPAMNFIAPPGYVKQPIPPHDPANFEQPTVVAAFVKDAGKPQATVISIQMENYDGDLSGFETNTSNQLREQSDGVFISNKKLTTLSNGMPAYYEEVSLGEGFNEVKRYQYVWVDGVRGVVLAISGHYGAISEEDAKKALADASGVAFPRRRY